jgi:hypothetical protein
MSQTKSALITAIAICLLAGSTVAVAAQEEPVEVSGEVTFSGSVETWTTDDPRLTGEGTWDPVDGSPMEPAPDYFLNARSLTTDEGVWRQLPVPQVTIEGKADDPTWDMVLIGEGGYEGLVFIAQAWTCTATSSIRRGRSRGTPPAGRGGRGRFATAANPTTTRPSPDHSPRSTPRARSPKG